MAGSIARTARATLDLLLPRHCLVCGNPLGAAEQHLCLACEASLPLTYHWDRVQNPMADRFNETLERERSDIDRFPYAYACALLFYRSDSPYAAIPQALKYHGDLSAGRRFGSMLGRRIASAPHLHDIDLVVPVPLYWTRRWQRGYNQAAVLARAVAEVLGVPVREDILRRNRSTRTQTRLDADARSSNLRGAFSLRHLPEARHILLVDDTFTTGATLAACHQALRSALDPSTRLSIATLAVVA